MPCACALPRYLQILHRGRVRRLSRCRCCGAFPRSNLNPKLVKLVARTILNVAQSGIQVFIATHSLFLMRELHILQQREFGKLDARYFGLHISDDAAVSVQHGKTMDDMGDISSLDEELAQSDRYLDTENKLTAAQPGE